MILGRWKGVGLGFANASLFLYRLFHAVSGIAGVTTQAGMLIKGNSISASPKQATVKYGGC